MRSFNAIHIRQLGLGRGKTPAIITFWIRNFGKNKKGN